VAGSGCDRLLAWSADGSTLLCLQPAGNLSVFALNGSALLDSTPLAARWSPRRAFRRALSRTGAWLAFVDEPTGLVVLPRASYSASLVTHATIASTSDAPLWDFGFSADETRLWVQQGPRLYLSKLVGGAPERWVELPGEMPQVPSCEQAGLPIPEVWCGAPQLTGSAVIESKSGRHIAYSSLSGDVSLVDVEAPITPRALRGSLSTHCASNCIQFQ
jgi:hypothetical protein